MMKTVRKTKKTRTRWSLNLILWFSFTVIALVIVLLYLTVQSLLVGTQYRTETVDTMKEAAGRLSAEIEGETVPGKVWRAIAAAETEYDVGIRLLYAEDGRNVFGGELGNEDDPALAEEIESRLSRGASDAVLSGETELGYAKAVEFGGERCFLYISSSMVRLNALERSLQWLSLATAIFSVVLAFFASGFVAMRITKPVTEVTARARKLALGSFDFDAETGRDYFCSEIEDLSEALDYARQELSKTDKMQKELIANVSHDFKTPLTMIKAYASMIREISGDDKQKRDAHAQIIIDETDRLAALVGDLLDLSKLSAGVGEQAPTVFNLSETVYKIVGRFDFLREPLGYCLETDVDDECYAYADRARIEQVLYNLIGNAVNYTGEDKKVFIRLKRTETGTRFDVTDTGQGIPEEELGTIWDRYYRSKSHKRPVQGTGLGLSIVKGILLLQKCPFGVTSEVGKGSCFWVEFPLPPDETADPELPAPDEKA